MTRFFQLVLISILFSCADPDDFLKTSNSYFNLDSLVESQVKHLSNTGRIFSKTVSINENLDTSDLSMDSLGWSKEFAIVKDLNINRPRYLGAYEISRSTNKISYQLKETEKLPVVSLEIEFDEGGLIQNVTGKYHDKKAELVYSAYREVELNFLGGVLENYSITGFQEMIFKGKTNFEVKASAK